MTQPPILTIGKNLSGIDVLKDKTNLITKLYPRGTGSPPSELTFDNPQYWPAAQNLVLDHTDSAGSAYFTLPNAYSTYAGFTKAADQLPGGYYVSRGTYNFFTLAGKGNTTLAPDPTTGQAPNTAGFIQNSSDAIAIVFYVPFAFRPYSATFQLQRIMNSPYTQWTTQPRFVVGLYSTTPTVSITGSTNVASQLPGFYIPYQGPLVWCYGNLLSINPTVPQWYRFPLQTNQYPAGWYAVVVMPYPTSNAQWGPYDYLAFGGSPAGGASTGTYVTWADSKGVTPKSWWCPSPGESTPWAHQIACNLAITDVDCTSKFLQADLGQPGRYLFCRVSDRPSGGWSAYQWVFHYMHSPYLINWDAYTKYGKYEGTLKDDTITTQAGLIATGSQYLASVSEPSMTISLGAVDLYAIDPEKNWAEELTVGGAVRVIDDLIGLDEECIITKIDKNDLTQPHTIDTLTLNNIHINAQRLLAQIATREKKIHGYMQGTTVESPQASVQSGDTSTPAYMALSIRDVTTLVHGVKLSILPPGNGTFKMVIDGNPVK